MVEGVRSAKQSCPIQGTRQHTTGFVTSLPPQPDLSARVTVFVFRRFGWICDQSALWGGVVSLCATTPVQANVFCLSVARMLDNPPQ